jgi:organic hydroperoxide reductase OsmC/OhrA
MAGALYKAEVVWERRGAEFVGSRYSRTHELRFEGGVTVPGSAAPTSLPPGIVNEHPCVDPEQALVAALSGCHMLFALAFFSKAGFVVDRYVDNAVGEMGKNERGRFFVSKVTLAPAITFSGEKRPTVADIADIHHRAHDHCYIANSVRAEVVIDPPPPVFV